MNQRNDDQSSEVKVTTAQRLLGNRRIKKVPLRESTAALKGCNLVLTVVALLLGFVLVLSGWTKLGIATSAALLLLSFSIWGFAVYCERKKQTQVDEDQNRRDKRALKIVEGLQNSDPHRPIIFLRPHAEEMEFSWDVGMLGTYQLGNLQDNGPFSAAVARRDIEGVIAKIADPLSDLIRVGGEPIIGGGRIDNREAWREIVELVCNAASIIFMLPLRERFFVANGGDASNGSDSITEEVMLLKSQRYFNKTIFIMPPKIVEDTPDFACMRFATRKSPEFRSTEDGRSQFLNLGVEEYWSTAREHFSKLDVNFPPFNERGLAFFLSEDGTEFREICELTAYQPGLGNLQDFLSKYQNQAPPRMGEVLETWGKDTVRDSKTVQIWPLLSCLLDLVDPIRKER